jgi:hypothetical protein
MTQAHAKIRLDDVHLKILEDLERTEYTSLWVHDHHLWQGHTVALKMVYDEWAERGTPMRGLFDTNVMDSSDDPVKPNCFMRPKPNGGWDVYRFGEGTEECSLWDTTGKCAKTVYNHPATLKQICLACGGYEGTEDKQGFMFDSMEEFCDALEMLGSKIKLPERARDRALSLHSGKEGKVVIVIEKKRDDENAHFPRYVKTARGWERWVKDSIETSDKTSEEETLWFELDNKMRALKHRTSYSDAFDSWVIRDSNETWTTHPRENVKSYLSSVGFQKPDPILGGAVYQSWTLVNEPFQPEYPGGRLWNRDAAQFIYTPVELADGEAPKHPTWTRVMEHCGAELTAYIEHLPWCKDWGIKTGGDYLTAWVSCMFQNPFGKLPYLFMYGPQNCGKSSFYESLELLVTTGVQKADRSLTSKEGYNGELANVVLAVIDEVDISKAGTSAYNKIKDWVTGVKISIHAKYKQVQDIPNTLHFVQIANDRSSLPMFPGDTRITMMRVSELVDEIPRDQLHELLRKEAPHFMRTLVDLEIPEATGRLMLPIIETPDKAEAAAVNMDELDRFVEEQCFKINGSAVKMTDFKNKFHATLEDYQKNDWSERVIRNKLSEHFPVGRGGKANQIIIGNMSFDESTIANVPYIKVDGRVVREL